MFTTFTMYSKKSVVKDRQKLEEDIQHINNMPKYIPKYKFTTLYGKFINLINKQNDLKDDYKKDDYKKDDY